VNRLDVELFAGPVQQAPGDVLLVLLPEDERPVRGDAGLVDWRLAGKISSLVHSEFCSGRFGEATLLPADSRLGASRVLLAGLGSLDALRGRGLERALTLAGAKLLGMKAEAAVLALPEGIDLSREAASLLLGLGRALAIGHPGARLSVVIPDGARRGRLLRRAWPRVFSELQALGVEARLDGLESRGLPRGSHPGVEVAR
jgi:hypothetical protein